MIKTLLTTFLVGCSILLFASNGLVEANQSQFIHNPPKISIYPNPTSDYFSITNAEGIFKISVYNLVGKEMRTFNHEESLKYNISDLPNGMYLVQLIDANKKIVNTQRLQKR